MTSSVSIWDAMEETLQEANDAVERRLEKSAIDHLRSIAGTDDINELRVAISETLKNARLDESWEAIVEVIGSNPLALSPEDDQVFYQRCPRHLVGDCATAVFKAFMSREKTEENDLSTLDAVDIRMMHMVIDAVASSGELETLRKVANIFDRICDMRSTGLPTSVFKKLVGLLGQPGKKSNGKTSGHQRVYEENSKPAPGEPEREEPKKRKSNRKAVRRNPLEGKPSEEVFQSGKREVTPDMVMVMKGRIPGVSLHLAS